MRVTGGFWFAVDLRMRVIISTRACRSGDPHARVSTRACVFGPAIEARHCFDPRIRVQDTRMRVIFLLVHENNKISKMEKRQSV